MAKFSKNDDSLVVIIGSGAGGGVLGMELAMKGIKTVVLEAGGRHGPQDFVNDEWASFGQISWLDQRTTSGDWRVSRDFSGLPSWIVKAVGGQHYTGLVLHYVFNRMNGKLRQIMETLKTLPSWTGQLTIKKWTNGTLELKIIWVH